MVDSQKRQIAPQAAAFQQTNMRYSIYPDLSMTYPFFTNYLSIFFHIERVQLTHSLGVCVACFLFAMPARPVKLLAVKIIETETGKKKTPRTRCDSGGCIIMYYVCMTRNHAFFKHSVIQL